MLAYVLPRHVDVTLPYTVHVPITHRNDITYLYMQVYVLRIPRHQVIIGKRVYGTGLTPGALVTSHVNQVCHNVW